MTNQTTTFLTRLRSARLIPILRSHSADHVEETARSLLEADLPLVELTLTTPDCFRIMSRLSKEYGPDRVGIGTILRAEDVQHAVDAGAGFLVTPVIAPEVIGAAQHAGLPIVVGAFTPTEVALAATSGATAVKLFPASSGGPAHIGGIRDVLPDVELVATGGITVDNATHFISAGALAVGFAGRWFAAALSGQGTSSIGARTAKARADLLSAGDVR